MLREGVETLFAAARRHGTGNVEEMFKSEPELRGQLRTVLTDGGPSFTHGFDRWAAGDWDLSPSASRSRSRKMHTKPAGKRARARSSSSCSDRKRRRRKGRRSDSSGSRHRKKRRRRSRTRSSTRSRSKRSARSPSVSKNGGKADKVSTPQLPSFTKEDIDLLPTGALRTLCVQRGVLPAGIVERTDLLVALAPFATAPTPKAPAVPVQRAPAPAVAPRKTFTRSDLESMSVKDLRAHCIQNGVLPPPPLEKGDLLQALLPFVVTAGGPR